MPIVPPYHDCQKDCKQMPPANEIKNPGRSMELSRASVAFLFFDSVGIKFLRVCVFSISLFV